VQLGPKRLKPLPDNRFNGLPSAVSETVETVVLANRFNGFRMTLSETVETVVLANRFNGLPSAVSETVETVVLANRFNGLPCSPASNGADSCSPFRSTAVDISLK